MSRVVSARHKPARSGPSGLPPAGHLPAPLLADVPRPAPCWAPRPSLEVRPPPGRLFIRPRALGPESGVTVTHLPPKNDDRVLTFRRGWSGAGGCRPECTWLSTDRYRHYLSNGTRETSGCGPHSPQHLLKSRARSIPSGWLAAGPRIRRAREITGDRLGSVVGPGELHAAS